jgi:GNAT superfamily N-acetyltransferase
MTTVFTKETMAAGHPARIECLEIAGQTFALSRGPATVVQLEDEWYDDVRDPCAVLAALRDARVDADVFTFWQRLPECEPRFAFVREWESIAALPVTTYDHWWSRQIKSATRALVRKAEKQGVSVRESVYDDEFVRGMTAIFNETPVRQGRKFWHYGKDFETVKRQFSRCLFREDLIGAYLDGELVGFAMVGNAGRYALLGQIISKAAHRDKGINNALIAAAVALCERRRFPFLVYYSWGRGSLVDFKRHNGFEEVRLPRYQVPLSMRGRLALKVGLHRGWKDALPSPVRDRLKRIRTRWLELTLRDAGSACRS